MDGLIFMELGTILVPMEKNKLVGLIQRAVGTSLILTAR